MNITAEEVTLLWILMCSMGGLLIYIRSRLK